MPSVPSAINAEPGMVSLCLCVHVCVCVWSVVHGIYIKDIYICVECL